MSQLLYLPYFEGMAYRGRQFTYEHDAPGLTSRARLLRVQSGEPAPSERVREGIAHGSEGDGDPLGVPDGLRGEPAHPGFHRARRARLPALPGGLPRRARPGGGGAVLDGGLGRGGEGGQPVDHLRRGRRPDHPRRGDQARAAAELLAQGSATRRSGRTRWGCSWTSRSAPPRST